jgi:hypothetical protein
MCSYAPNDKVQLRNTTVFSDPTSATMTEAMILRSAQGGHATLASESRWFSHT